MKFPTDQDTSSTTPTPDIKDNTTTTQPTPDTRNNPTTTVANDLQNSKWSPLHTTKTTKNTSPSLDPSTTTTPDTTNINESKSIITQGNPKVGKGTTPSAQTDLWKSKWACKTHVPRVVVGDDGFPVVVLDGEIVDK